jgi:sugar phosphate isomerase/epimerase
MDTTIDCDRRKILTGASAVAFSTLTGLASPRPANAAPKSAVPETPAASPFLLGLNTSTIRGQKLSITQVVDIAASAGYRGLEPWVDELDRHVAAGRSLDDVRKQIADAGISVESAIGFFDWIVDEPARRKKGLESARRAMESVKRIGGKRIAAPPVGATDHRMLDPRVVADRYRDLLAIGDEIGVVPQVEVWGFSQTLGR